MSLELILTRIRNLVSGAPSAASTCKRLLPMALPLFVVLTAQQTAHAGAGTLETTVTRLQPNVTYGNPTSQPPLQTYVGYQVTMTNTGGNTINDVRFEGATSVTEALESAVFASIEGTGACTVGVGGTSLACSFGQLKAGQSAPTFTVFFKAPAKAAGSTVPDGVDGSCTTTDCVAFAGRTLYAEGTGGPKSPPDNSIAEWGPVYVPLGTSNPTFVRSAVQKAGGTLFTGKGALTTLADPFSTTVTVPAGASFTTAQIAETGTTTSCSVLTTCYTSDITVPGTFSPYLEVVLRLDAAAIPNGTKIASILVSYDGLIIGACASPTTPRTDGIPCIAARKAYSKNSRNGTLFPLELEGDFEWTLINTRNGSVKIF